MVDEGVAESGAECDDEFVPVTGDDGCRCYLGVVQDQRGDIEACVEGRFHVEVVPRLGEFGHDFGVGTGFTDVVRGVDDDAVADHSGHTKGDAVETFEVLGV